MGVLQLPALRCSILFALGILIGRICAFGFEAWLVIVLLTATGLCVIVKAKKMSFRFEFAATVFATILMTFLGSMKYTIDKQSMGIPEDLLNDDVLVIGEIITNPEISNQRARFVLTVERVRKKGEVRHHKLNVLVQTLRAWADTVEFLPAYGMKIGLYGKLMRLSDARNPGEFSPKQYYEANGIYLAMRVRGIDNAVVLDSSGGVWLQREVVVPVRTYIMTVIDHTVGGREGEFLKGILIGERGGMTQQMKEAFANSGTAHVLAVSGSNVVVVAAFIFTLLEFLRVARFLRIMLTCVVLVLYMFLTGSQPPVVRATIMALILMMAMLLQEKPSPMNSLGVAALLILGLDARQLFDVGFQLSFSAVCAIIYMYPIADVWVARIGSANLLQRSVVWLLRVCALSFVATIGTLPLTAMYFGKVSVMGILANIIVVPAVGLSVILGFISLLAGTCSLWLAETYGLLNQLILRLTIDVVEFSGNLTNATVETFAFRWLDAFPFYSGVLCAAIYAQGKRSAHAVIVFLVALNVDAIVPRVAVNGSSNERLRVTFLDVGQGDAVLLQFPSGRTILIDAGPRSETFDAGKRVIVPALKRQGISSLDLLVITHPHSDHLGGADAVFDHFDVKEVLDCGRPAKSFMFEEYTKDILNEKSTSTTAMAGSVVAGTSSAKLYVLYPLPSGADSASTEEYISNLNNVSVVLKLCYGNVSFLFTGDAEEEAEQDLMRIYGSFLNSTILKVGHHGSSTSTSEEFLRFVQPKYAVVSVGLWNKFNHPSSDVISRLVSGGAEVSRTDEEGAILFESDGKTITTIDWH